MAARWVGYLEKDRCTLRYYEDKTANAGVNNYTRFGRLFDLMLKGDDVRTKDGYSWCAMFVAACLYESVAGWQDCSCSRGGLVYNMAAACHVAKVAAGGGSIRYHAGVAAWYNSYKVRHKVSHTPSRGDFVVFLDNAGKPYHIGIVEQANERLTTFVTIEGNTSAIGDDIIANGGCVARKMRKITKKVAFLKN